jgi:hypothetical protein
MCKTKLHTKRKHGKNHEKTTVKKQTVQQLSENMPPSLTTPTTPKTTQDSKKTTKNQQKAKKNQSTTQNAPKPTMKHQMLKQLVYTREPKLQKL